MPTTTLTDAVVQPLDEGIGGVADGAESYSSAAAIAALAAHVDGAYHEGLAPTNVSAVNDTADIGPGRAYVLYNGGSGNLQSGRSGGGAPYDTALAASVPLLVEVPAAVTLQLDTDAVNDVHLAVDLDGSTTGTAGDAYLAHGSSISAPSDPSVLVGTADTAAGTATSANGPPLVLTDSDGDAAAGDESVALGIEARAPADDGSGGTIGRHAVVGYQAAQNNTGDRVTAAGYQAARNNTGDPVTAAGYQAARDNTDDRVTAAGYQAAQNNTGFGVSAAGHQAAQNNTGASLMAAGYQAARNNTGFAVTAAGYRAARDNTGSNVTAAGHQAARNNTGFNVTVAGSQAARGGGLSDPTTMGDDNIGIGKSAIRNNQASGLIAIGQEAGINAQTDDQLIITDRNGNRRMQMDLTTGDLSIEGSLTENATL